MISHKSILLAIFVLAATSSCNDEVEVVNTPVTFSVNPTELDFDYKEQSKTLALTCSTGPRNIRTGADWCTAQTGQLSNNSMTVTISVTRNDSQSERSTTIIIVGDSKNLIVKITQGAEEIPMEVSQTSFEATCSGIYDGVVTVKATTRPEVTTDAKWISTVSGKMDSENKTEISLYVGANRSTAGRIGEVTVKSGTQSSTIKVVQKGFAVEEVSAEDITPRIVYEAIQPGWNLGNQMDGYSQDVASETVWGNKKCTQATMDGVAKAGFKSVRIPVTWMGHIGEGPVYKIDDAWMERVAEIVGYAKKAGLTAIVNTHHDENNNESEAHWLDIKSACADSQRNETIKDEIFCVWSQIATRFKDEDEWLILEPFNELQDGGWGWSAAFRANPKPQYKILNEWNQIFVDAVRATGGKNATRWLATVGYAQSSSFTIPGLVIPQDCTSGNRLIVAFHDYDPYNFTIADPFKEQWGHTADPAKRCSDTDEQDVVSTFDQFVEAYINKNIPVYMGEMGCSFHSGEDFAFQKYYMEYFCKAASDRGIPIIVWDNGAKGTGSECHSYIDHSTGEYQNENAEAVVKLIIKAVSKDDPSYTLQSVWDSAPEAK